MIQELLGGAGVLSGEGNISFNAGVFEGSPSPSPTATTTTTTTTTTSSSSENLRCPRCDSSNTKFCYYNNYNLTQPRHFCKTCRRYWTKGGALRNIPIGGGCRKNKGIFVSTTTAGKSTSGKAKTTSSSDIVKSITGFDHEPPSNPILWGSPQNSQLLALYRSTQNLNPNPYSVTTKDHGAMIGSHVTLESAAPTSALNARTLSLDPLGQVPIGLSSNAFWRNNQHHQDQHYPQQNLLMGEVQNTGIQELYQRLRSSANYFNDHSPPVSSSFALMPSISEPASTSGGELNYWNPSSSWSDLQTTNGAFP